MQLNKLPKKGIIVLLLILFCLAAGAYRYWKKRHFRTEAATKFIGKNDSARNDSAVFKSNFFFDLETLEGLTGIENIKVITAHSGKMACDLRRGIEYGPSVIKKVSSITLKPLKKVSASFWIYPLSDNPNTVLTVSIINSKDETVFWDGKSTEYPGCRIEKQKWTKVNAAYNLPSEKISADDLIKVNIWNKGKTQVIIDDIEIVYGESAGRRGADAGIDANAIYEKRFVPQKNKPPFKVIYFEKQEIHTKGTSITSENKDLHGDVSPNDEFLAGNFVLDKNNLEELICIKKESAAMFEFSPEKHEFSLIWETADAEKTIWNEGAVKFAGDFNADGKADVLMVNKKNGSWELFDFSNQNWGRVLKGNENLIDSAWFDTKNKPFVSSLFSKDKKDALTIITKSKCITLQLNKKTNTFDKKEVNLSADDSGIFKSSDNIYTGNFRGESRQEILKLNTDWRFDFKLIDAASDGYSIDNTIDFSGYQNDYNPKYYEFVKIISGKFCSREKTSLLIMMRNCKDINFKGIHCNQFENLSSLPNSTALYNLNVIP